MPRPYLKTAATVFACAAAIVAWTYAAAGQQRSLQKRPAPAAATATGDWPTYGHDPGGMRFSPLTQLTPANVANLKVAWVYHMKPAGAATSTAPPTPEPEG